MKRVGWIDAARYIAIFHVVFIHTLDTFSPRVLDYWVTPPTSYIPFLLNAKTAVLFFCVLLGFFAAKQVQRPRLRRVHREALCPVLTIPARLGRGLRPWGILRDVAVPHAG